MAALVDHDDAVGDRHDQVHVMLDHHHRDAAPAQLDQQVGQPPHVVAADAGGRLVEQHGTRAAP